MNTTCDGRLPSSSRTIIANVITKALGTNSLTVCRSRVVLAACAVVSVSLGSSITTIGQRNESCRQLRRLRRVLGHYGLSYLGREGPPPVRSLVVRPCRVFADHNLIVSADHRAMTPGRADTGR